MRQTGKHRIIVTRSGLLGSAIVLVVALVCVRLGFWQLRRLDERRVRNAAAQARLQQTPLRLTSARRDSTGLIFRRVIVSGDYDDDRTVVIAGRSLRGVPGVHVLTPLKIGGAAVLVNRGWMPSADAASIDFGGIAESSPRNVAGIVLDLQPDPRTRITETADTFRRVWYHASIPALREQYAYPIASYVVQLLPAPDQPRFPIRLRPPELDEGPHLGYAVQWFSFAVIAVAGWIVLLIRRRPS